MISSPLSVKTYSLFTGKDLSSTLFSISPSLFSSFSRAESTFWVMPSRQFFSSEKRLVCLSPLYNSKRISRVHFFAIYFTVWLTVHPSCIGYLWKPSTLYTLVSKVYYWAGKGTCTGVKICSTTEAVQQLPTINNTILLVPYAYSTPKSRKHISKIRKVSSINKWRQISVVWLVTFTIDLVFMESYQKISPNT